MVACALPMWGVGFGARLASDHTVSSRRDLPFLVRFRRLGAEPADSAARDRPRLRRLRFSADVGRSVLPRSRPGQVASCPTCAWLRRRYGRMPRFGFRMHLGSMSPGTYRPRLYVSSMESVVVSNEAELLDRSEAGAVALDIEALAYRYGALLLALAHTSTADWSEAE